jgi:hypothetical protein
MHRSLAASQESKSRMAQKKKAADLSAERGGAQVICGEL